MMTDEVLAMPGKEGVSRAVLRAIPDAQAVAIYDQDALGPAVSIFPSLGVSLTPDDEGKLRHSAYEAVLNCVRVAPRAEPDLVVNGVPAQITTLTLDDAKTHTALAVQLARGMVTVLLSPGAGEAQATVMALVGAIAGAGIAVKNYPSPRVAGRPKRHQPPASRTRREPRMNEITDLVTGEAIGKAGGRTLPDIFKPEVRPMLLVMAEPPLPPWWAVADRHEIDDSQMRDRVARRRSR